MTTKLKAKCHVAIYGVNLIIPGVDYIGITSEEAIDLHRSLTKNMKRIKRNAKLWKK